jgi:putative flippase GtrA
MWFGLLRNESMTRLHEIQDQLERHRRLIRFVITGGLCAALFFCLNYGALRLGLPPFAANLTAYAIAFTVGYLAQRGWTFGGRHSHRRALPRYAVVQACCAVITSAIFQLSTLYLHAPKLVMSLFATAIAGFASYVASSLWVFTDGDSKHSV